LKCSRRRANERTSEGRRSREGGESGRGREQHGMLAAASAVAAVAVRFATGINALTTQTPRESVFVPCSVHYVRFDDKLRG